MIHIHFTDGSALSFYRNFGDNLMHYFPAIVSHTYTHSSFSLSLTLRMCNTLVHVCSSDVLRSAFTDFPGMMGMVHPYISFIIT